MGRRRRFGLGRAWAGLAGALAALVSAAGAHADQWARPARSGDVVYFGISQGTPRVERYDLGTGSWLDAIPVPALADAIAVAPDAIYVQDASMLRRIAPEGAQVWAVSNAAVEIAVDPGTGLVFALDSPENLLRVFDADDGRLVDELDFAPSEPISYFVRGLAIAPGLRRVFVHWNRDGVRIAAILYDASGTLGDVLLSEEISDGGAGSTWVFPGEDRVTGQHGQVLDAGTLEWRDSLLGGVGDLAFDGAAPLRLQQSTLLRFGPALEPLGTWWFEGYVEAPFVRQGILYVFERTFALPPDPVAVVTALPLTAISYPPLPVPEVPVAWPVAPRLLAIDAAGTISFERGGSSPAIYRWSVPGEAFLPPVPVRSESSAAADCPALGSLLLDHRGELRRIPYAGSEELHWRNVPSAAVGLACTARHVVVVSGGWEGAITTYSPDGEPVDSVPIGRVGSSVWATWSAARARVYVWKNAAALAKQIASYAIDEGGGIELASEATSPAYDPGPILGAEGPYLLSGGYAHDSETLAPGAYLGRTIGATWHEGLLFALQTETFERHLSVWDAAMQAVQSTPLPGAFALFGWGGALRAVILEEGVLSVRAIAYDDIDGDGFPTDDDAFPGDPEEWSDRDGDGVGDNADFDDYDPTEWSDRDGDHVGDNRDAFPDDPSEWLDSDDDGYGDRSDWQPYDASEWRDSDGDDVGDNADRFPFDPLEQRDFDGDGIGDRGDPFPVGDPLLGLVDLVGKERIRFSALGSAGGRHPGGSLGLLPDGGVSFCGPQSGCLFGRVLTADPNGRRFELEVDPAFVAELETALEQALPRVLSGVFHRSVSVDLVPRPADTRIVVKIRRSGQRGVFEARWRFDAYLGNVPRRYRKQRFSLAWRFEPAPVVRP